MSDSPFPLIDVLGQPALKIQSPCGAQATVSLHGAHIASWQPAGADEQLYLSPRAVAGSGQAIRGGIPVIFPQFEQRGPDVSLPRHGLARTRLWQLTEAKQGTDHAQATLRLSDDDSTRAWWPHSFELELTLSISGPRLDVELYAHNTGTSTWPFSAALHTYLAVSDLSLVRLQGLDGCRYIDSVLGGEAIEDHPEKRFHSEIDRIYTRVRDLLLRDGPRRLLIESENMPDAVIWNPGPDKCAALKDMPADDWQHMLCIEAARIMDPVTLGPDEDWTGRQTLILQAA
ncbi:MAG: D-hexose-6-phosphate mutarotase [Burkholderiales bacterium]|nr:D-hexose-6-phosphate mutarotase [Burkholderiales bacterium]